MELRNITVRYGEKLVLDHFSLQIPPKGVLCLFGPSGCGKTTLLRVLCGLISPEEGQIPAEVKAVAVFQEDRLLPWLTLEGNLTAATGRSREEADRWLKKVGLEQEIHQKPDQLSGGMRRRVAMARALGAESDLLLLDEPFTGVDEETKQLLYPLIQQAAEQKPVLLVTHHRQEAQMLGAQILELTGPPLNRK